MDIVLTEAQEAELEKRSTYIRLLNRMNYSVVLIDNRYYAYDEFIPYEPQLNIHFSTVMGRDITNHVKMSTITSHTFVSKEQDNMYRDAVELIPVIKREFSDQYKWIRFLRY